MKKRSGTFEEKYFKGNKSTYTSSYDYKAGNIQLVYEERVAPFIKTALPPEGKVLDVACAFGDLLHLIDRDGYKTYGIDISHYAIEKAKKRTAAKLSIGDVNEKMPYKTNFFNAIFALDIIEHVDSPYRFLIELHRLLKKNGFLFIQTPNINSVFEKISKDKWFGYRDETHLHLFTRKSLGFLAKKSGFLLLTSQTFAAPFPPVIRTLLKQTDIGGNLWLVAKKV